MNNRQKPHAIIFDLDGLLIDSEPVWHKTDIALVESRGKIYDTDKQAHLIGMRAEDYLKGLRQIYGIEDDVETLDREALEHMLTLISTEVKTQPGANELVAFVAKQNITRAIVSNSQMVFINAMLEDRGWDDIFMHRFTGEDDPQGKPAPDVYLRAAKTLGLNPADCLALEDSPNGARAAVAAGMTCYAVPDTSHSMPEAFAGITEHVFGSLHEVLKICQQW